MVGGQRTSPDLGGRIMGMSRLSAQTRVGWLTVLLALATLAPLSLHRPESLTGLAHVPWWVLAAIFAVTEACVVQVRVGQESQSLSLSEIPLVMGLFLAEPRELLAARLLGGAVVFVLVRRQTARKAAFNTALNGAGAATALITFHLLLAGSDPLDGRGWLAAVTAAVVTGVLD